MPACLHNDLYMLPGDMEQPKKPPSSYFIWLAENREALKQEAGGGNLSMPKLAGEKWMRLPDAQKAPSLKKAADLKKQYEKDMQEFKKAGGEAGKRRADEKALKDAMAGKKAKKSDLNIFCG
ncbi:unnamed protein product [Polarella glacialis]|uniref:HMG box domain-containing protein n=1 Tax=Polarella glacialis TaxID=89957 RepID=A0A813LJW0_POLGL|nr:unnamed protein product [Polarella glacialis]